MMTREMLDLALNNLLGRIKFRNIRHHGEHDAHIAARTCAQHRAQLRAQETRTIKADTDRAPAQCRILLVERLHIRQDLVATDIECTEGDGLAASRIAKPLRVAASPVQLECKFHGSFALPGNSLDQVHHVVRGRVVGVHIRDNALTADGKQRMKWELGETEEHCETCAALNGIVAFAREWETLGVHPQDAPNNKLECGGWQCGCTLTPTSQRRTSDAYGRIEEALLAG